MAFIAHWEVTMRKTLIAAASLAVLSAMPMTTASAQDPLGGAIVGGVTGGLIGGAVGGGRGAAVGAAVGATTGAVIGAQGEPRYYRYRERVCWFDDLGYRHCRWRYD